MNAPTATGRADRGPAMSAPRRRIPAERQAQVEALHASIAAQVEQLRSTEQWRAFLDFARSFRTYRSGGSGVFEVRGWPRRGGGAACLGAEGRR
jgi:hypothetical protein